jgi:DNA polymerase-3 subunit epsilon
MLKNSNFTVIDLEATGPISEGNHMIDVGIVRIEKGKVVQTYQSLLHSPRAVPPSITQLTGIRDDDLVDAPLFKDIVGEILPLFENSIFVGHNANFDYGFLNLELMRLGKPLICPYLCTKELTHRMLPDLPKLGLDALMEYFQIRDIERHRALPDAELTARILLELLKMKKIEEGISEIVISEKDNPLDPQRNKLIESLSEGPGIYYFYDEFEKLIYLSAAADIRAHAGIHFVAQIESKKEAELCKKIKTIKTTSHPTELEALIMEAREVRKFKPRFNRFLKHWYPGCYLWVTKEDYPQLLIEDEISDEEGVECIGPYPSRKLLAALIEYARASFNLCDYRTGRQSRPRRYPAKKSCAGVKLKRCLGACIGKVSAGEYETQVKSAVKFFRAALKNDSLEDKDFKKILNDRKTEKLTGSWKFRRTIKKLLKDRQLLPDLRDKPYLFEEIDRFSGEKVIYLIQDGLLVGSWHMDDSVDEGAVLEKAGELLKNRNGAKPSDEDVIDRLVVEHYLGSTQGYRRKIKLDWLSKKGK